MPSPNTPATRPLAEITAELEALERVEADQLLDEGSGSTETDPAGAQSEGADSDASAEYEARRQGWRPQDEYQGPKGKWVDAKTFLQRGERFTRKLENEIATLKAQVASFDGTRAQFRKFFDDQMAKKDREYAEAVQNLRRQKLEATREGNDDLVLEIEDRLELTQQERKNFKTESEAAAQDHVQAPAEAATPANNPVMAEWAEDTPWFNNDKVLSEYAMAVAEKFRAEGVKTVGRAFLDRVAAKVEEDFPRRTREVAQRIRQNPADGASGALQSGGGSGGTSGKGIPGGKSARDLPPEDLKLMREFIKDGLYTEQTFLASYFSRAK